MERRGRRIICGNIPVYLEALRKAIRFEPGTTRIRNSVLTTQPRRSLCYNIKSLYFTPNLCNIITIRIRKKLAEIKWHIIFDVSVYTGNGFVRRRNVKQVAAVFPCPDHNALINVL